MIQNVFRFFSTSNADVRARDVRGRSAIAIWYLEGRIGTSRPRPTLFLQRFGRYDGCQSTRQRWKHDACILPLGEARRGRYCPGAHIEANARLSHQKPQKGRNCGTGGSERGVKPTLHRCCGMRAVTRFPTAYAWALLRFQGWR